LIARAGNDFAQYVVCGISLRAPLVNRVDHQVRGSASAKNGNTLAVQPAFFRVADDPPKEIANHRACHGDAVIEFDES
jgi:hypothetical protein